MGLVTIEKASRDCIKSRQIMGTHVLVVSLAGVFVEGLFVLGAKKIARLPRIVDH